MKRPLPSDDDILAPEGADALIAAEESSFGFDELFFSRTDKGGVIKYGNNVFQRVSAYDWEELLGKPHKIVRHPDTPRAVFWLLWDSIKKGEPIGAYVKNRAKDGRYYWVFALVTPVKDGYLSVRLRPSSQIFDIVKTLYPDFAEQERRENLTPAQSAEMLAGKIAELGFKDYKAFMAAALGQELLSRDKYLKNAEDKTILKFVDLSKVTQALVGEAERISTAYESNSIVPTNFRILASQLGQDGAAIGVISDNYSLLSQDMHHILKGFIASANRVVEAINTGYFLSSTARVQREMLTFFEQEEADDTGLARGKEMTLLRQQQADYITRAHKALKEITTESSGFRQTCTGMDRLATALEVMRVVGKVECSRHDQVKERVDDLLGKLENFQRTITKALKELARINALIHEEAEGLQLPPEKAA